MTRQKKQDKAKLGRSGAYKGSVNGCTFWIVYNILPNIWHVGSTFGTSLWKNEKNGGQKSHCEYGMVTKTKMGRPWPQLADWSRGLVTILNPVQWEQYSFFWIYGAQYDVLWWQWQCGEVFYVSWALIQKDFLGFSKVLNPKKLLNIDIYYYKAMQ